MTKLIEKQTVSAGSKEKGGGDLGEGQQEHAQTIVLSNRSEREGNRYLCGWSIDLKEYAERYFVRRNCKCTRLFQYPTH